MNATPRALKQDSSLASPSDSQIAPQGGGRPLCLACSPRRGGNSDFAGSRIVDIFNGVVGDGVPGIADLSGETNPAGAPSFPPPSPHPLSMELLHLRDNPVAACVSCGVCDRPGLAPCSLDGRGIMSVSGASLQSQGSAACQTLGSKDYGPEMFDRLFTTPLLLITSPIYFYHVPTLFKALMDRGQYWWMRKLQDHPRFNGLREKRPAHILLLCARPKGERLFEGSLLSLQYFLSIFGFELKESLLLKGLDGSKELAGNDGALRKVDAWGQAIATGWKI